MGKISAKDKMRIQTLREQGLWYCIIAAKYPQKHIHTHALCFNGHFSRWTWVSWLPP